MLKIIKKIKNNLSRNTQSILDNVRKAFIFKKVDSEILKLLEESLYRADFGTKTTNEIISEIRVAYKNDKNFSGRNALNIGISVLERTLLGSEGFLTLDNSQLPDVICLIGINGSGKTTTAAKLSYFLQKKDKRVLIGACDTFRAAANEQIQIWANRFNIELVSGHYGADPAAIAYDSYSAAKARKADYLILDTAGRLHNKANLMEELKKIFKVLSKKTLNKQYHRWLVIDGNIGLNSIEQACVFHKSIGITGLVITKLDGTSRGGTLFSIYRTLKIPIYYVSLGEDIKSLESFSAKKYIKGIFTK